MNKLYALALQFIKFGLVGVSNTLISFCTEMLFYYVVLSANSISEGVRIIVASGIAFVISVTNSYYWNNKYVFTSGAKTLREHLSSYIKTMISYAFTGLILSPFLKILLVTYIIDYYWLASIMALVVSIPINFIMNKFWAFRIKNDL